MNSTPHGPQSPPASPDRAQPVRRRRSLRRRVLAAVFAHSFWDRRVVPPRRPPPPGTPPVNTVWPDDYFLHIVVLFVAMVSVLVSTLLALVEWILS